MSPDQAPRRQASAMRAALLQELHADAFGAELATPAALLFSRLLRLDAADAAWPDRDRLVLPVEGRALAQTWAALTEAGAHPVADIVDAPAGQTLAIAVGQALAERMSAARFGRSLVDHRVWAMVGPGELGSGLATEAGCVAGELGLARLCVLVAGGAALAPRWASLGWATRVVAGDQSEEAALSWVLRSRKPTCVFWTPPPTRHAPRALTEPADEAGAQAWRVAGARGAAARRAWLRRLARHPLRDEFFRALEGRLPERWQSALSGLIATLPPEQLLSSRGALRLALERLLPTLPELAGGDADPSPVLPPLQPGTYIGRAVAWRQRVGAMAGCLNGMAMHGGWLPVGGAPIAGADSLREGLSFAAHHHLRVIQVLTAGPAQTSACSRIAGFRAIPNLHVFRPANAAETLECGELALRRTEGPSLLLLSEHAAAAQWHRAMRTRCARGAYLAREPTRPREATLIATGPELALACEAAAILAASCCELAVVSLPCWELFAQADADWREALLGAAPRIGLEAGQRFGWDRWIGSGLFVEAHTTDGPMLAATIRRYLNGSCNVIEARGGLLEAQVFR